MSLAQPQKPARLLDRIMRAIPHFCALCHSTCPSGLCHTCHARYFADQPKRCSCCAQQLPDNSSTTILCGTCLKRPPAFDHVITATDYIAPVDQLVQSFKFGGNLALAPLFAQLLTDAIQQHPGNDASQPSLMTAVPLAQGRLATRGFNQALEIAKPLSRQLGIPLMPQLVIRVRETAPQTTTPLSSRSKNIRGAFAINETTRAIIADQHIALVDDVLTTGATMGEIARLLKQAGAARISCFVLTRTSL